ncbi:hypothetical protein SPHINGO391_390262 [Sphingomonas aurantiaca]|uniref:Uncharacterized protein n=1 Tax=Sphingomonas aurantiaca TaxID=185949 RepID=A0A5E7YRM1_9SPHN|nr:hypothetical protein SPHINGO391_390262 [Sphingomonas aurantiaca]
MATRCNETLSLLKAFATENGWVAVFPFADGPVE